MLEARYKKHTLNFKIPGGTSRGVLKTKDSWIINIFNSELPDIKGIGEASIIRGLSIDDRPDFEKKLNWCLHNIENYNNWNPDELSEFPSINFALETAFHDLQKGGKHILFESEFTEGRAGIPINGLIWMGTLEFMSNQIINKIKSGFKCIKLKIGAIEFEKELSLLKMIRNKFSEAELEVRVDANGAFSPDEALEKLNRLSEFGIHSIEQPIKQRQWNEMSGLCRLSPIPIALDEELIGIKKEEIPLMLDKIHPQYIILKPSLLGGFKASKYFIKEAEKRNISWWVTSALEANIGLNAIAQWTATLNNKIPQGLGTGGLFTNNIPSPLYIKEAELFYRNNKQWSNLNELFFIQGKSYDKQSLSILCKRKVNNKATEDWEAEICSFILQWLDDNDYIIAKTSGSTGKPKEIKLLKKHMKASARATLDFLKIESGGKAMLCLPANYIAGKMMIVRAFVGGLELNFVKPTLNAVFARLEKYSLIALIPGMISNIIDDNKETILENFDHILLGGTSIPHQMENKLQILKNNLWHTYGMTETISHIALRRINGPNKSESFTPLRDVKVKLSEKNTLRVDYPKIGINNLITNDIAIINHEGKFIIKGRTDNLINSGGIKLHPEEIEGKISKLIENPFFIYGLPDKKLGKKIVLYIEGKLKLTKSQLMNEMSGFLEKKQIPKQIVFVKRFARTTSNKVIRKNYQ
jgi:o-succinylbenzoate synthase